MNILSSERPTIFDLDFANFENNLDSLLDSLLCLKADGNGNQYPGAGSEQEWSAEI